MRVSPLVLKGATRGCKRVGEWKDIRSDQKVRSLGAERMPIHAVGGDGDFRDKICAGKCDPFGRKSTKGYATNHAVLFADLPTVQKLAELLGLGFCGDRRRQSHPKSFCPRPLNPLPCFGPCTGSAMLVVAFRGRAVDADLQCQPIARQSAQSFQPPPDKKHPIGQYSCRSSRRAGCQDVADVREQERLAASHENLADSERCCLTCDPPHLLQAERSSRRLR